MAGKALKIDFSGVEKEIKRGSSRVHIPEADYVLKIIDHELVKDKETKRTKGIRWNVQVVSGKYKGKKLGGFTSLKPEALWSLRNLIYAALGKNVAGSSSVSFDPARLYGKIVGGEVVDNEYTKDGTTRVSSQVNTFFPKDEVSEAEDDEDEEDDEETEEDEEEEDEDLEEVEVDEL